MSKFCILPWVHVCSTVDGTFKPCCSWYADIPNIDHGLVTSSISSKFLENVRTDILSGKSLKYCESKCGENEKNNIRSLRQIWNDEFASDLKYAHHSNFLNLKYLEIALDTTCNLQCRMCSSTFSSALRDRDLQIYGIVRKRYHDISIDELFNNFDFSELRHLKLIGGDPMYSKKHLLFLEKLISLEISENITIHYSTNGMINNPIFSEKWKKFKKIHISISLDGIGKVNDYQRVNAEFSTIENNIISFLNTGAEIKIHTTITILNILHLYDLCKWTKNLNLHHTFAFDSGSDMSALTTPDSLKKFLLREIQLQNLPSNLEKRIISEIKKSKYDEARWVKTIETINKFDTYHKTSFYEINPDIIEFLKYAS